MGSGRLTKLLQGLVFLLFTASGYSQPWTGILDPSRAIDWSATGAGAGVIPPRTTTCATMTLGATLSQINSALASCASGQAVMLSAGTYIFTSGSITFPSSGNVTLRGAGPTQTILIFTGTGTCEQTANICLASPDPGYDQGAPQQPGGSNSATWSAGYTQGTTQITLTGVGSSAPQVGTIIFLDQQDDTADNGGYLQCVAQTNCSVNAAVSGRGSGSTRRSQVQAVTVTGISGSTYTISPGLQAPNWRSSQNPGAWWGDAPISNVGVENLTVDNTNTGSTAGVLFYNCSYCWAKNIRSINGQRDHMAVFQSVHVTIRDSYFYATNASTAGVYGVEFNETSDDLIENNISQQVGAPFLPNGACSGLVFGYNFSWNNLFSNPAWLQVTYASHEAGVHMELFEGNYFDGISSDNQHGSAPTATFFRNWFPGNMPAPNQKSEATWSFELEPPGTTAWNIIGNVLGTPGYHTQYEAYPTSSSGGVGAAQCNTTIYVMGWSGVGCSSGGSPANDTSIRNTMFRWGNYDTVHGSNQFNCAEASPAAVPFINANPCPASQALPKSLYLSSRPSWWGAMPWPAVGPDVTGGPGPGGEAYQNPAYSCFLTTPADPTYSPALAFDANTCYATSVVVTSVQPPSSLRAVPR